MVIETVGSCCTLVAEKVTKDSSFIMDAAVAELLYGKCETSVVLNPSMPVAAKTTNYFGNISLSKPIFGKYLKESCSSELYLQLSFK